jgi:hypothetical protein
LNFREHLLTCLIEELSEVQQEVAKCLRFGVHDKCSLYTTTNWERVRQEWSDVWAVTDLLGEKEDLYLFGDGARKRDKKERTLKAWSDFGSKSSDRLMKTEYQAKLPGVQGWFEISKAEFELRRQTPELFELRTVYVESS